MTSHRGRGSLVTSTPRMSKSMISAGTLTSTTPVQESMSLQPTAFFPFKLTATLSALKIVCGCVLVGLGAAAIIQKAGYAWKGAGIAGGVVVIISGVLGAYSVRTGAIRPYVISFLLSCLCSLIASVVVIIYSSTGLAADANAPYGVVPDEDGDYVRDISLSPPTSREAAMLINTVLIIVSFLDIIFSLPSIIITLRELCNCYDPTLLTHRPGQVRADWLMSWLGHQPPVFYSHSSGVPYNKMAPGPGSGSPYRHMMTRNTPPFVHIPSDQDQSHSGPTSRHSPRDAPHPKQRQRSKSPNPRHAHSVNQNTRSKQSPHHHHHHQHQYSHHHPHYHPHAHHGTLIHPQAHYSAYAPIELFAPMYPPGPPHGPPPHHPHLIPIHHPMAMHGQWVFGPTEWDSQIYPGYERQPSSGGKEEKRRTRDRDQRKRSRSKSQPKENSNKRKKTRKGPTDSDIEKTYTGMDRELAEEFIEQTMDPGVGVDQTMSGTESEAW